MNRLAGVLKDPSVRYFCKNILKEAQGKDSLDAILDVELALDVLKTEYQINHGVNPELIKA